MRHYISCQVKGASEPVGDGEIILSLYGPKGGNRAIESLTLKSAALLRDELNKFFAERRQS